METMYKKNIKILFVCGNLANGGAQRVISVLAGGLNKLGYNISIIVFCRTASEYKVNKGVEIYSLASSQIEYDSMTSLHRLRLLRKVIRKINPDISIGFIQGGYALYLASLGLDFIKISSFRNNPDIILAQKGIRGIILKRWYKRSTAIVVQNKMQRKMLPFKMRKKTYVIPNPVFTEEGVTIEHDYDRRVEKIVMIGRLEKQKNYDMALKAMNIIRKKYQTLCLNIYGEGTLREEIEHKIKYYDLEKTVQLRGWTERVYTVFADSDMYILTSDYEGMPNALMEAMAAGLPCISTNCKTGPTDIIEDEKTGYLIGVNDEEKLIDRICSIVEMSPDDRRIMGVNARKSIMEKYHVDGVISTWEKMMEKLYSDWRSKR